MENMQAKIAEKMCKQNTNEPCPVNPREKISKMHDYLSGGRAAVVFKAVEALAAEEGLNKRNILLALDLKPLESITTSMHPQGQYIIKTRNSRGHDLMVYKGTKSGEAMTRDQFSARGVHEIIIKMHPMLVGAKPPGRSTTLPHILLNGKPMPMPTLNSDDQYNIYKDFYTKRIVYYVGDMADPNYGKGGPQIELF